LFFKILSKGRRESAPAAAATGGRERLGGREVRERGAGWGAGVIS
jgi:hypothetical protein